MSPTDLVCGNPRFVLGVHRIELPNDLLDLLATLCDQFRSGGPASHVPKGDTRKARQNQLVRIHGTNSESQLEIGACHVGGTATCIVHRSSPGYQIGTNNAQHYLSFRFGFFFLVHVLGPGIKPTAGKGMKARSSPSTVNPPFHCKY